MRKLFCAAALAGTLLLAGCDLDVIADSERYTEDFHHTYPLKPGGRLAIENFNGSVEISGWTENSIEINGTKYGASRDMLDAIKIDISASPDSISVRTIRPSIRHGNMGATAKTTLIPGRNKSADQFPHFRGPSIIPLVRPWPQSIEQLFVPGIE
jgi:hypothetical protein